jgi:hypothetical protein
MNDFLGIQGSQVGGSAGLGGHQLDTFQAEAAVGPDSNTLGTPKY